MTLVPHIAMLLSAQVPAYSLPPDLLAKARELSHLGTLLYFGGTAWQLLVLFLLLRGRAGAAIGDWAARVTERSGGGPFAERPFLQGLLVTPIWLLVTALIALPLALIGHSAGLRFGLSVEHWGAWWLDWIKGEALTLLLGVLVLSLLFVLLRRSPRRWWLWFWLIVQPCIILGVYLSPVVVDPLFNHFTPLMQKDPALVARLEQVAALGGLHIPPGRMFMEDASRRSTGMNAYVTGIGDSKRIVVWDTSLAKLPTDEILAIYAHEQGHYVLHHIPKGIAFSAALTFVLFALIGWLLPRIVRRYGDDWHIGDPSDWAALPLLLLLSLALNFLSAPAANAFSRSIEHAADVYGEHLLAKILPNASQVEVQDFNRLGRAWLDDPSPNRFVVWWTYSHPPTVDRADEAARIGSPGKPEIAPARRSIIRRALMETPESKSPAAAQRDINAIMALLPHRYPFLLIDRVLEVEPKQRIVARKCVTINEEFFQGHFPGYPIMPAVLQVEAIAQAGGILVLLDSERPSDTLMLFTGVERAKFRRPVVPGDVLEIEAKILNLRSRAVRLDGYIRVDGKLVCEAQVTCMLVPRQAADSIPVPGSAASRLADAPVPAESQAVTTE